MSSRLVDSARQGEVILMAGAGVSAGKPTVLPGWKAANAAIVQVLCRRLESAVNRPGWLSQVVPVIRPLTRPPTAFRRTIKHS